MNSRIQGKWLRLLTILAVLVANLIPMVQPSTALAESSYLTSVIANPSSIKPGESVNFEAVVTAMVTQSILVDLEIFDANGVKVFQKFVDNQPMNDGETKRFPFVWETPADQAYGTYTVSLGIIKAGWESQLHWHAGAATVKIVENPSSVSLAAEAAPNPAKVGEDVQVTVNTTSTTELTDAIVEVSVYDEDQFIVAQQRYTEVVLPAGQPKTFGLTWSVPRTLPAGAYTVGAEVLSADRKTTYVKETNKLSIQVNGAVTVPPETRAESYQTAAVAIPEKVRPGSLLEIVVPVTASSDSQALIDIEVYDPAGKKVFQKFYDQQTLAGNVQSNYLASWNVPEDATLGTYAIRVGIFKPGWGEQYAWNSQAGAFEVSNDVPVPDTTPPAVPADVTATAGDAKATVKWSAVTDKDLAGYLVYVSKDGGQTWVSRFNVGVATEYVLSGLTNGTEYTFAVSTYDHSDNESAKSAVAKAKPVAPNTDQTPPATPNITQTMSLFDGRVVVMFEGVTDADLAGYRIYASADNGQTWNPGLNVGMATGFPVSGLTLNQPYLFAVTAYDKAGNESPKSRGLIQTPVMGGDTIPPAVPTGLKAEAGDGTVTLTWEPVNNGDLANYIIYISEPSGYQNTANAGKKNTYTLTSLRNGTTYTFAVVATDMNGNQSAKSAPVTAKPGTGDSIPPAVPSGLTAESKDTAITLNWTPVPDSDLATYKVYQSEDNGKTWSKEYYAYGPTHNVTYLTNGTKYTFAVTAVDKNGNESAKSSLITAAPSAYKIPTGLLAQAKDGEVLLSWNAITDYDLAGYKVYVSDNGGTTWKPAIQAGKVTRYTVKALNNGTTYAFAITAVNTSGRESAKSEVAIATPESLGNLPVDPSTVAPALPTTSRTSFYDAVSFLFEGAEPIQLDMQPGSIDEDRIVVLKGKVLNTSGEALPGVKVTVLHQNEVGRTYSRADGMFDIAANGSNAITVQYEKKGYMTIQRKAETNPQDYTVLPDVVMTPLDTNVTPVQVNGTEYQVAQGSPVTDQDGTRQATIIFTPGTTAQMKMPDGSTQNLSTMNVRATEYTVGDRGPEAMPGNLPPLVAYTYAAEFSVDEAIAAGATSVTFNQPVYIYVDNFMNFPTGMAMPHGYYNLTTGSWEAEPNGVVIKIVGITDGVAQIDVDGDNQPDGDDKFNRIKLSVEERTRLATLYKEGQSVWRVPTHHFTAHDFNVNVSAALPEDFIDPPEDPPYTPANKDQKDQDKDSDDKEKTESAEEAMCKQQQPGSIIGCGDQSLGQTIPIQGTGLNLTYDSKSNKGYQAKNTIIVPITNDREVPGSLLRIDAEVYVAGKKYAKSFPNLPNQKFEVVWDGTDSYGRSLVGTHPYVAYINYYYKNTVDTLPTSWSEPEDLARIWARIPFDSGNNSYQVGRQEIKSVRKWDGDIESPVNPFDDMGIAGWRLSNHDFLSDADLQNFEEWTSTMGRVYAPSYRSTFLIGKDGYFYYSKADPDGVGTSTPYGIYRIKADGTEEMVAGRTPGWVSEVAADGTMYIGGLYAKEGKIWRKKPNETTWTHFAGGGTLKSEDGIPDGTLGTKVSFSNPGDYEAGPDGSLYFVDLHYVITRIDTAGRVYQLSLPKKEDRLDYLRMNGKVSGPATKKNIGNTNFELEIGPDGSIYTIQTGVIADDASPTGYIYTSSVIKKITPDGVIKVIAGDTIPYTPGNEYPLVDENIHDGAKATEVFFAPLTFDMDAQGNIYFLDKFSEEYYKISADGIVHMYEPDLFAKLAKVSNAGGMDDTVIVEYPMMYILDVAADGSMVIATHTGGQYDEPRYFRLGKKTKKALAATVTVPSADGTQAFVFNLATGRHLQTLNGINGKTLMDFTYDSNGRLISIKDDNDLTVTIERDAAGVPTAIISPYGQRTVLTVENGQLIAVENAAGEMHKMKYDTNGLMKEFTDPENNTSYYDYDEKGYLTYAETPRGGIKRLNRTEGEKGHTVTFTDPDNKQSVYEYWQDSGTQRTTVTDAAGNKIISTTKPDGTLEISYPDGSKQTTKMTTDPRWGSAVPRVSEVQFITADNKVTNLKVEYKAELADIKDPFSTKTTTKTTVVDGKTLKEHYDAATNTLTKTDSNNEVSIITFDEKDRVSRLEEGNGVIAPISYLYDEKGRTKKVSQGTKFIEYTYDSLNRIESITDESGRAKTLGYDEANRITSITTPGNKQYLREFDKNGNMTKVIMPDGTVYHQTFNKDDQFEGFFLGEATTGSTVEYTLGGLKEKSVLASGRVIQYGRDETDSNVTSVNDPDIHRSYIYEPGNTMGRVEKVESLLQDGSGTLQGIKFGYEDDSLTVKSHEWYGEAQGTFDFGYYDDLKLKNIHATVTSDVYGTFEQDIAFDWNDDNTLKQYGPFHYVYDGPGHRLGSYHDEALDVSMEYDEYGRVDAYIYKLNGVQVYREDYKFDTRGFIEQKTVVNQEGTTTYDYTYDDDGQLKTVTRTGADGKVFSETYEYDDNKNRKSREVTGSGKEISTYVDFDQLEQVGDVSYKFDEDGNLKQRGADTFRYAARGELLEATAQGESIGYTYDAAGRRTARKDSTGTTQYLYGNPINAYEITHTVDPQGVVTSYFYNDRNLLTGMERGGKRYYIITDVVGTPQQVLDQNGTVVKELRYDSYGVQLSDSNPAFALELGFAGGITDDKTGLIRFGGRDYDPASGRWTARDLILFDSEQANLYGYVNNNPTLLRDPCGRFCMGGGISVVIGVGGSWCLNTEGFGGCAEGGIGVGAELEVEPFGELPENESWTAEAGFKAGVGLLELEAKEVYDMKAIGNGGSVCSNTKFTMPLTIGPLEIDLATMEDEFKPEKMGEIKEEKVKETWDKIKSLSSWKNIKLNVEAGLIAKHKLCFAVKW
ncbi:fibronectin type III domain-containing protein [Brevibacillus dissolubilis]|uniref:fibronectin type III domain-containing protein n=1 Tax=Brevibacillus dissolubilis TaxID=1844116 RepID=UPI001116E427|nr:fibronectin type III domain-containing protein [Brevibacillus dissolubilis]